MRQGFVGGNIPAHVCCVWRVGEDHNVAICVCQCCELRANKRRLSTSMACVRVDQDGSRGLKFGRYVEVESDIGGIGTAPVCDFLKSIGCAEDRGYKGAEWQESKKASKANIGRDHRVTILTSNGFSDYEKRRDSILKETNSMGIRTEFHPWHLLHHMI